MIFTAPILQEIKDWAKEAFPRDFETVKEYLQENNVSYFTSASRSEGIRTFSGVLVGTTVGHGESVYANLVYDSLQYDSKLSLWHEPNANDESYARSYFFGEQYIRLVKYDRSSEPAVDFKTPFSWLRTDEGEVDRGKIEALVHYMRLTSNSSILWDNSTTTDLLKARFEGVCRDIAAGKQAEDDRYRTLGSSESRSSTPTTPRPVEWSSKLVIHPEGRPLTTEEILADLQHTLNKGMIAAQDADFHEKEELRAEVSKLQSKVAAAEQEREDYKTEVAEAEERARKAEEDAAQSKKEHEQLKKVMQDNRAHFDALARVFHGDVEMSG